MAAKSSRMRELCDEMGSDNINPWANQQLPNGQVCGNWASNERARRRITRLPVLQLNYQEIDLAA